MTVRLGRWWNGMWGGWHCRYVWLEQDERGGPFIVRWRGGDYTDRDGRYYSTDPERIIAALKTLMADDPRYIWRALPPE